MNPHTCKHTHLPFLPTSKPHLHGRHSTRHMHTPRHTHIQAQYRHTYVCMYACACIWVCPNMCTCIAEGLSCEWHIPKYTQIQGQQRTSFWYVIIVILRMKIDFSASFRILICSDYRRFFFVLITYRRKTAYTKCRWKRTIFHNKCELLKCYSYGKLFDQIYHNMRCFL